ncbi:hypothetical protein METP3_01219 [Methanosarcinales archaeon]|nr:hypothetical protein METP3_01219 [Methanosarcinales archaeon]
MVDESSTTWLVGYRIIFTPEARATLLPTVLYHPSVRTLCEGSHGLPGANDRG